MYQYINALKESKDIYDLYERLDWNQYVKLTEDQLLQVMEGSYYCLYIYHEDNLIATGRIISDGVLTSLICGVGVDPKYQNKGIGQSIIEHLVAFGQKKKLFIDLTCQQRLEPYYNRLDFQTYGVAMKYKK